MSKTPAPVTEIKPDAAIQVTTQVPPAQKFLHLTSFQSVLKKGIGSEDVGKFASALAIDSYLESPSSKLDSIVTEFPVSTWHKYLLSFSGLEIPTGKKGETSVKITWDRINSAVKNAHIAANARNEYKYSIDPSLRPSDTPTPAPTSEPTKLMAEYDSWPADVKSGMIDLEYSDLLTATPAMTEKEFNVLTNDYSESARLALAALWIKNHTPATSEATPA